MALFPQDVQGGAVTTPNLATHPLDEWFRNLRRFLKTSEHLSAPKRTYLIQEMHTIRCAKAQTEMFPDHDGAARKLNRVWNLGTVCTCPQDVHGGADLHTTTTVVGRVTSKVQNDTVSWRCDSQTECDFKHVPLTLYTLNICPLNLVHSRYFLSWTYQATAHVLSTPVDKLRNVPSGASEQSPEVHLRLSHGSQCLESNSRGVEHCGACEAATHTFEFALIRYHCTMTARWLSQQARTWSFPRLSMKHVSSISSTAPTQQLACFQFGHHNMLFLLRISLV